MKRLLLCFLCFLLLCGCQKGNISTAMEGLTDPRGSIPFDQRSFSEGFLETSFADYYTMCPDGGTKAFIQVKPKGSDSFVPLCGKPNCTHNDDGCNAVCIVGGGLGYCDNRLFTVDDVIDGTGGFAVVSMLPDGTDRQIEIKIPYPEHADGTQGGSYQFVFHGHWLLALYVPPENLPIEEQVERLFVSDLQTNTITEPFSAFFTSKISLGGGIRPTGDIIYTDAYFRDEVGKIENWWIAMDMDSGEVRKLFTFESPLPYTIENDIMYYQLPGVGFMEYDLRTGQTINRGLPIPEAVGSMKLDGDFIYTFTNAGTSGDPETRDFTMYFLNREYEVLDQIHLGPGVYPRYEDTEYCYFVGPNSTKLIYCLSKSQIGTGILELKSLS